MNPRQTPLIERIGLIPMSGLVAVLLTLSIFGLEHFLRLYLSSHVR